MGGFQGENDSHCVVSFLLQGRQVHLCQPLPPRRPQSLFFNLPSTPPSLTHSFTTPFYYSFISHSTEPLTLLQLPSTIHFSLFASHSILLVTLQRSRVQSACASLS